MAANFGFWTPTGRPGHWVGGVEVHDDFIAGNISVATASALSMWDNVGTTAATVAYATDEPNGAIDITAPVDTGSEGGLELNGEPLLFSYQADFIWTCKFKVSSLLCNLFFGLHEAAFDIGSGAALTARHIGFTTQQDGNLDRTCADGTTQTLQDTTKDIVINVYTTIDMVWRAQARRVNFYVNGASAGDLNLDDDTLPQDTWQSSMGMHVETQGAATILTVDYIGYKADRVGG